MGKIKESIYLWQLSEMSGIIALQCLNCSHRGFVPVKKLTEKQQQKAVYQLKARCNKCRGTDVKACPYVPL